MEFDGLNKELEKLARAIREGSRIYSEHPGGMDADEVAALVGAAFQGAGYKTRLKAVRQAGQRTFHHVFVEVYMPDAREWIPIDPQRTPPGDWEEERVHKV